MTALFDLFCEKATIKQEEIFPFIDKLLDGLFTFKENGDKI